MGFCPPEAVAPTRLRPSAVTAKTETLLLAAFTANRKRLLASSARAPSLPNPAPEPNPPVEKVPPAVSFPSADRLYIRTALPELELFRVYTAPAATAALAGRLHSINARTDTIAMLKFNFNLIVSLPFTTAKEQRSVRVQSEIQDSESARVIENLSSGCRRSASIGMSAGEENSPSGFVGRCRLGLAECIRKLRSNVLITGAALLLVGLSARSSKAQFYAGVLGGVSTLSGDTSAVINSNSTNFSTYNPQNGLALNGLLGRHLSDIFTIQADYVWNRNPLNLTGSTSSSGSVADYEETRRSSQQSLFASVMVYFRNRRSRIRPYLSVR